MKKTLATFALVALAIAPAALARGKKAAVTTPGTYKQWGPDIDEIEIVKSFKLADYDKIVVIPFDTSSTQLPEKTEKSYDSIKSVLAGYNLTLTEALKPELKGKLDVQSGATAPKTAKTLIVRGTVIDLSPGSRAKRYIGGFGAGAAGTKLTSEVVDAKSGAVLLRYTQERRSGGTFKFAGGNDMDVMRDSIHAQGQDLAHILDSF